MLLCVSASIVKPSTPCCNVESQKSSIDGMWNALDWDYVVNNCPPPFKERVSAVINAIKRFFEN